MDEQVQAQEEMRGERSDFRDQLAEIVSLLSEKGKAIAESSQQQLIHCRECQLCLIGSQESS
jgi:hypothetical protein